MASPSLLREGIPKLQYVCQRCTRRALYQRPLQRDSRRGVSQLTSDKDAWAERAQRIRSGKQKSMLTILEERGLVKNLAGTRDEVDKAMTDRQLGVYVGFDPTASSLHVGHLLPLMPLFWMYLHGYHTVTLVGGATAKIGDPTDRLTTRDQQQSNVRAANTISIQKQLHKIWQNAEAVGRRHNFNWKQARRKDEFNNSTWWDVLPMLEFLQVLGPGMRLGSMLARDTNKMSKGDGMSWAEFTYPLMQAWDWWHMFINNRISMQIGGSDQYGNITAGIEAVKYITKTHPDSDIHKKVAKISSPFGFTAPLMTTASGTKFGKSAGNAVWLDSNLTSVFDLYGYFLRTPDVDISHQLKMLSFLPTEYIEQLVVEHARDPSQRKAQHALAREVVTLVHGEDAARNAEQQHRLLFGKSSAPTNEKPIVDIKLPQSLVYKRSIGRILQAAGLAASASEGQRLAQNSGAYIGSRSDSNETAVTWNQLQSWDADKVSEYLLHDDLLFLRKGKQKIKIVQVVSDDEYESSGERYAGMDDGWRSVGQGKEAKLV